MPIFPELRPHLEAAWEAAAEISELDGNAVTRPMRDNEKGPTVTGRALIRSDSTILGYEREYRRPKATRPTRPPLSIASVVGSGIGSTTKTLVFSIGKPIGIELVSAGSSRGMR